MAGDEVEAALPNRLPEAGAGCASFDCVAEPNPVNPPNEAPAEPMDGGAAAAGLPKSPPKAFDFGSSALGGAAGVEPKPPNDGFGASSFFSAGAICPNPPKRDLGASDGLLPVADSAGLAPKENGAVAGGVEDAVCAGLGAPNSCLLAVFSGIPNIILQLTLPLAGAGAADVFAESKLNREPALGVLAPDCGGVFEPSKGGAAGVDEETPKLKPVEAAGATGATGAAVKKLGGAGVSFFSSAGVEDGLPRPRSAPAVFLGCSIPPNRLPAGAEGGATAPPNPENSEVAGGFPAGVVEPEAGAESEKNPPAGWAGAGSAAVVGGATVCGGDSGAALIGALASGDVARGLCVSNLARCPFRGTPNPPAAGCGPRRLARLPDSVAAGCSGAAGVGAGAEGVLAAGAIDPKLTPENRFAGSFVLLLLSSRSSISGRSSSSAENRPDPGVLALAVYDAAPT